MFSSWMVRDLRQELAPVHVLVHHQPDEVGVAQLVVVGEAHQGAQGGFGRQVFQLQVGLNAADARIGFLQHPDVQAFLAAEVVVDHPLAGAGEGGDLVDPGAGQALAGELGGGHLEDVGHGPLRVVGAPALGQRRAAGLFGRLLWGAAAAAQRLLYCLVHHGREHTTAAACPGCCLGFRWAGCGPMPAVLHPSAGG